MSELDPIMSEDEATYDCEESNTCVLCDSPGHFNDDKCEFICDSCEAKMRHRADEQYAQLMDYHVEQAREIFEKWNDDSIREYWWHRSEHGR